MAYRSSAATDITSSGSGISISMPSGVAVGDYLLAFLTKDTGAGVSTTPPSGWTLVDTAITANASFPKWAVLYDKIADGTEGASQSWTLVSGASGSAIIAAWSGRKGSSTRTFETQTINNTQNTSPITLASASGSAAAGDDIAYFVSMAKSTADTWSLTAPSGFTTRVSPNWIVWVSAHLATKDNQGAGAVGTLAGVETGASGDSGYATFVVAMAQASATTVPLGFKKWVLRTLFGGPAPAVAGASTLTVGPWTLPTKNEDGSAIGTITNQTVYYDTVSRMGTGVAYANSVSVGDGVTLSKVLTGLTVATTYYYATTVTVGGVESDLGMEASGVSTP